MKSAVPCNQSLDLVPGNYMLRLGVIDQFSKRIGALTAWVTVPGQTEAAAQAPPNSNTTTQPEAKTEHDKPM
jgi:hypothetical protein